MNYHQFAITSMHHIKAAQPILLVVAALTGVLGIAMVVAGVTLVWLGAQGDAQISVFGAHVSTTNVGLGSIFCGLALMLFVFRRLIKALVELGTIGEPSRTTRVIVELPDGTTHEIEPDGSSENVRKVAAMLSGEKLK